MEKIESYRAYNGRVFEDKTECIDYEKRLDYADVIKNALRNIEKRFIRFKNYSIDADTYKMIKKAVPLELVLPMYRSYIQKSQFTKYIESNAVAFIKIDSLDDIKDLAILEMVSLDKNCHILSSSGVHSEINELLDDKSKYNLFLNKVEDWFNNNSDITSFPCVVSCASGDKSVSIPEQLYYGAKVVTLETEIKRVNKFLSECNLDYALVKRESSND